MREVLVLCICNISTWRITYHNRVAVFRYMKRQNMGRGSVIKDNELFRILFWGAPKSLQMVIAAMKLKDAYSLEGKL